MKNREVVLVAAAMVGAGLSWSGRQASFTNLAGIAVVCFVTTTLLSYFAPKRCAIIGFLTGGSVTLTGALTGQIGAMLALMVAMFGALVGYGLDKTWRDNDGTPA